MENNKIVKIKPVKNAPSSAGELCIKGKYGFDFAQSENRITKNLIILFSLTKPDFNAAKIYNNSFFITPQKDSP